jgi:hypothetical protein
MIWGISGSPVDEGLPFGREANLVGVKCEFPPCWLYGHGWIETIAEYGLSAATRLQNGADPATGLMPDGSNAGHGIMQLTSSWPPNWEDSAANFVYAVDNFLMPAVKYWHGLYGYAGSTLVLLCAATFNEGLDAAKSDHAAGNVDAGTTNEYGHRVVSAMEQLLAGMPPDPNLAVKRA